MEDVGGGVGGGSACGGNMMERALVKHTKFILLHCHNIMHEMCEKVDWGRVG